MKRYSKMEKLEMLNDILAGLRVMDTMPSEDAIETLVCAIGTVVVFISQDISENLDETM